VSLLSSCIERLISTAERQRVLAVLLPLLFPAASEAAVGECSKRYD
jgi:hypothetical protein